MLVAVQAGSAAFDELVARLARRGESDFSKVEPAVREILQAVRTEGDVAVHRYVERFEARRASALYQTDYAGAQALASLAPAIRDALGEARQRIARYHEKQAAQLTSFQYTEGGVTLGSRVTPLERVGVYVPGGKARYPSSVLMSAVIARVAGVRQIIVASPDAGVEVRAACHVAGVHALLDAGGAHAVGALAYGTQSIPKVDKIVGPGNVYVAAAKRLVFGEVDIDSIAGPSEILVVADESADAAVIAADLLSQAEHDEAAYALLVTTSAALVDQVRKALGTQLATLPRRAVAEASLLRNGAAFVVADRDGLANIANRLAAEHVALHVREAADLAQRIERAGAIFVGAATPEAAGDYLAGPSHVLPTGGAARHAAPLGVYDFVSRSSIISYDTAALSAQAGHITALARVEGLEAHARAVEVRLGKSGG